MVLPRITIRWLMVAVAVIALVIGLVPMWQRRQLFLELAAQHAQGEAFNVELAKDLAGKPLTPPSQTVSALLPDGTVVQFQGSGAARKPHFPPTSPQPADEETVKRLVEMCRRKAEKEGRIRQAYQHRANRPWMAGGSNPE